jgi:hypothetical protein
VEVEASFGTVMEFSVALAGFSAVAIALSHERGAMAPLDRFRALNILTNSLGPAFAASLVLIGAAFGASGPMLWRLTSVGALVVALACMVVPILLRRGLDAKDRRRLSLGLWILAVGGNPIVAAVLLMNTAGSFGAPGPGPIIASLMWWLLFSAVLFVRMLVNRPALQTVERDDKKTIKPATPRTAEG